MSDRTFSIPLIGASSIGLIVLTTTIAITPAQPSCSVTSSYKWENVAIGGGGYVTGVYPHPLQPNLVYIRTDIGGFYRWNSVDKKWIPLTDHFPLPQSNYYGGEALALDPQNPNVVYIAAGKYTSTGAGLGTIFKSTNQGNTWTKLPIDLPMGGNQEQRWASERLVVNPMDSNIIFFGSRINGLWKSSDGGRKWAKVTSFVGKPQANIGISNIVFHKTVPGLVYANAYGDGIYVSNNTGLTWRKISGSPSNVNRLALASNGTLYATHSSGVSKYTNKVWTNITPPNNQSRFSAIAVNPNNPNEILSVDHHARNSETYKIFKSTNGGSSWVQKNRLLNSQVPWWPDWYFASAASDIEFDPKIPGRVWLTDWYGTWQTEKIDTDSPVWSNYENGHEQAISFALVSPKSGSMLFSGLADVDGFKHNKLDTYPCTQFGGTNGLRFQDTYSIAYSESNPLRMVRVGGNRWNNTYNGATSTDGGQTWNKFSSFPQNTIPLRVAISATNPNLFVVITSQGQPLHTTNGGASWSTVLGLPYGPQGPWYWGQPLAADNVSNVFYYYSNGKVYRSSDSGASFSVVNSSLAIERWSMLKTVPGVSGEVWVSLNWKGLHRSTNGGKTFTKIPLVERAYLFAFGKPQPGSTIEALYLYGKITGLGEGVFRSLDNAKTWTSIGDPQQPIGNDPNVMEASQQEFGLVFLGTNGRGIYYGKP